MPLGDRNLRIKEGLSCRAYSQGEIGPMRGKPKCRTMLAWLLVNWGPEGAIRVEGLARSGEWPRTPKGVDLGECGRGAGKVFGIPKSAKISTRQPFELSPVCAGGGNSAHAWVHLMPSPLPSWTEIGRLNQPVAAAERNLGWNFRLLMKHPNLHQFLDFPNPSKSVTGCRPCRSAVPSL